MNNGGIVRYSKPKSKVFTPKLWISQVLRLANPSPLSFRSFGCCKGTQWGSIFCPESFEVGTSLLFFDSLIKMVD